MRRRHVVDDRDHQVAGRRAVAVGIRHHHRKARAARRINQRIVDQRIAVGDHPGARRRIVGERRRQRAGRPIRKRLRRAGQNVTAQRDHRHPVQRGERDRPRHRLRRVAVVGRIAVRNLARARGLGPTRRKAVLENRRRRSARRRYRVGRRRIPDRDRQRGMRQIAVAVLDRVGEHVVRPARRAGVARVAVAAVRGQRQLAEGALDRRSPASPRLSRLALVVPAATPDTTAPSAPRTSTPLTGEVVPTAVITLPVSAVN